MPPAVPIVVGPRLQVGDLLSVGRAARQCRVVSLTTKGKAICVAIDHPNARPFTCTAEFAMRHRMRFGHGKHVQTLALHAAIRRTALSTAPQIPTELAHALVEAAAAEGVLDAVDRSGCSALHLAAGISRAAYVVELLIARGADVNAFDLCDFGAPLLRAARCGAVSSVVALLEGRAQVDAACRGGVTALMRASADGHAECVAALCRYGANVHLRETFSSDGHDALTLACLGGSAAHLRCAQILATYGTFAALTLSASAPPLRPCGAKLSGVGGSFLLCKEPPPATAAWLRAARAWCTPLHHAVAAGNAVRARELLRDDVTNLHARLGPEDPTPLELGAELCGRAAAQQVNSMCLVDHGGDGVATSQAEGAVGAVGAAALVMIAARAWSPETAELFPRAARQRAGALGRLGQQLARRFGNGRDEHALWELWVAMVMPQCVHRRARRGGGGSATDAATARAHEASAMASADLQCFASSCSLPCCWDEEDLQDSLGCLQDEVDTSPRNTVDRYM